MLGSDAARARYQVSKKSAGMDNCRTCECFCNIIGFGRGTTDAWFVVRKMQVEYGG